MTGSSIPAVPGLLLAFKLSGCHSPDQANSPDAKGSPDTAVSDVGWLRYVKTLLQLSCNNFTTA